MYLVKVCILLLLIGCAQPQQQNIYYTVYTKSGWKVNLPNWMVNSEIKRDRILNEIDATVNEFSKNWPLQLHLKEIRIWPYGYKYIYINGELYSGYYYGKVITLGFDDSFPHVKALSHELMHAALPNDTHEQLQQNIPIMIAVQKAQKAQEEIYATDSNR